MRISDWSSDVCSADLLRRAMLVRAHDKCGVHADCGCCRQIIIMGCDHDALRWLQAENIRRVEIALRIGLVAAHDFGPQNAVPGKKSEERRVGKAEVSTCVSRWSPIP